MWRFEILTFGESYTPRGGLKWPDPAWVRAELCSTHQDLSFDTKFGYIYDIITSDPPWT